MVVGLHLPKIVALPTEHDAYHATHYAVVCLPILHSVASPVAYSDTNGRWQCLPMHITLRAYRAMHRIAACRLPLPTVINTNDDSMNLARPSYLHKPTDTSAALKV